MNVEVEREEDGRWVAEISEALAHGETPEDL